MSMSNNPAFLWCMRLHRAGQGQLHIIVEHEVMLTKVTNLSTGSQPRSTNGSDAQTLHSNPLLLIQTVRYSIGISDASSHKTDKHLTDKYSQRETSLRRIARV